MKKLFTLLTLLLCVASSAWADAITVTWLPNGMTEKTTAGSASTDGILTVSDFTMSSPVSMTGVSSGWGCFTTTTTDAGKNKASEKDYLTFTVTVKHGYNFIPTQVTATAGGAGTGDNGALISETIISSATSAKIAKASEGGTALGITPASATIGSGDTYTFYIHIGSRANTDPIKGVNIKDVVLTGTYTSASTDPAPASITTQPSDIEAHVGIEATLSVEAAGYPAPEYQWYSCDDTEKTNAKEIDGATSASYSFTPETTGILYFYVIVQNENNTVPEVSNVATVTVTAAKAEAPTFTVYGNTVQLESATDDATIYYELDNPDVKTSETKVKYTGAFIPASSGTVYAYAEKAGFTASDVSSKAVTLSTVGDVVGGLLATVQAAKNAETTTFGAITVTSPASPAWDGRGVYPDHMKVSGTVTLTASSNATIQSIKIYGTSNDGSKVATITAGSGATVVSSPAELMPRDVKVGETQAMTEIVITVDEPAANNSVSFTLGRESRLYVEVYGVVSGTITPAGWSSFASSYPLDLSTLTATSSATAYYASAADGNTVTLTSTTATVPAGEGLMIKGTAGETFTIGVAASGTAIDGNLLKGQTTTGKVTASTTGAYHYVFGYQTDDASVYGFYNLTSDTNVEAGKAYLETGTELAAGARSLSIVFDDETTGIENLTPALSEGDGAVYNLSGQRVAQPTKGLYIVNGKKVIIK